MRVGGVPRLDEIANELDATPETGREVRIGGAAEVIARAAEEAKAEFVVVGSRGLGSVGALLLGSVSRSLATHGPSPTLIVPASASPVEDGPIICAVDESDGARAALATAADVAERLGVKLLLVTVEGDDAPSSAGVERLVAESGLGTRTERILLRGEPAGAIVDAAATYGADLIVIGSRGRGALAASMFGSVSSSVAGRAACPVMVVRAAG
jgi:nucleotide-binding universal stress UspA family protein